jgi:hypothetical protein
MLLRSRFRALVLISSLAASLAACSDDPAAEPDAAVTPPVEDPDAGMPDAQAQPDARLADAATPDDLPDASTDPDADFSVSAPAIVSFANPFIDHFAGDITGFRFTIGGADVTVTDLGFFDDDGDGLGEAHAVGIYAVASQLQVVSTTVPAGTEAPLDGAFRYVPIAAPVTLTADTTYVALAYRPTATDGVAYFVDDLKVSPLVVYNSEVAANNTGGRGNRAINGQGLTLTTLKLGPNQELA